VLNVTCDYVTDNNRHRMMTATISRLSVLYFDENRSSGLSDWLCKILILICFGFKRNRDFDIDLKITTE